MRAEILYPHKSTAALTGLRDQKWRELARRIASLPEDHPDSLAFSLMMMRQCDCLNCNPDRYKALMGCSACARRTISAVKGSDETLLRAYRKAREDVLNHLEERALAKAA
jgi:hypothetical protein